MKNLSKEIQNESEDRFEKLMKKLDAIASKLERTEDLFIDGLISKDRLKKVKEELEQEREGLQNVLEKESKLVYSNRELEAAKEAWTSVHMELREVVDEFFANAPFEDLKTALDMLVDRVIVDSTKKKKVVTIRLKIPFHINIADAYYENESITSFDDSGKEHVVMTTDNLVPALIPLGDIHDPIIGKKVVFKDPDET